MRLTACVVRFVTPRDRRAASVRLTTQGRELVDRLVPEHTQRVTDAFAVLDEAEKRMLTDICRKLAVEPAAAAV